ncbi:MAG: thiamine phosphate synthase [Acidiferrobacterales bacterium]
MNKSEKLSRLRGLYAIADTSQARGSELVEAVAAALRGGASVIQYRDKTTRPQRHEEARSLRELCDRHAALLIINDDISLAADISADGVHLGREDIALDKARERLGKEAIIGVSCYNQMSRAQRLVQAGADYVAFGAFFESPTKPEAISADIGLITSAKRALKVPVVAIGGITPENGAALINAGADALAVISGVFAQKDPEQAAHRYAALFARSN